MPAFRSPKARAQDVDVLTHEQCSELAENESIKYRTVMPHRVAVRIADEAAMPMLGGRRGQQVVGIKLRSGTVGQIKLEEGIVDWTLFDEDGNAVAWEYEKRASLVEGLSPRVRSALLARIDNASPAELDQVADEDSGETVGNGSGESFATS